MDIAKSAGSSQVTQFDKCTNLFIFIDKAASVADNIVLFIFNGGSKNLYVQTWRKTCTMCQTEVIHTLYIRDQSQIYRKD